MTDKEIGIELEKHFGKPPLSTEEITERLKSCSKNEALEMVFGDFTEKEEDPDEREYQLTKLDGLNLSTKYKIDLAICLFTAAGKEIKEKENQK
tara:strand:+ start:434 stop:715 length:282 start_codon:yes stop_codon:yes gene_type:complete